MTTTTNQDDPILLVHAYVDGELEPAHALEVERRLAGEPALAAEHSRVVALRRVIGERLPPEATPSGLARRIEAAVGLRHTPTRASWRAMAASVVLAALAGGAGTGLRAVLARATPGRTWSLRLHARTDGTTANRRQLVRPPQREACSTADP
jgi:anti-sigma factor RsiW